MENQKKFIDAGESIIERINFLLFAVQLGELTPEQAGVKMRSLSIELGVVAAMPFNEVNKNLTIGDRKWAEGVAADFANGSIFGDKECCTQLNGQHYQSCKRHNCGNPSCDL